MHRALQRASSGLHDAQIFGPQQHLDIRGRADARVHARGSVVSAISASTRSPVLPVAVAGTNAPAPTKRAANSVAGFRYSASGRAICSIRPSFMSATYWDMLSASSWSWVTSRNVVPSSRWIRSSSSRRACRTLRSRAESGSSSSSTRGWRINARATATRWAWPPLSSEGRRAPEPGQSYQVEHLGHSPAPLGTGWTLPAAGGQPEGHVVLDVQVREQRVALEHDVERSFLGRPTRDVGAVDQHLPVVGRLQPGENAQQRGLTAAAGAEQAEERAGRDVEVTCRRVP